MPKGNVKDNVTSCSVTQDDIHDDINSTAGACSNWQSGLAGRGVLVDYYSWALKNGIEYNAVSTHACILGDIKKIIAEQNVVIQPGDILFLRTGMWEKIRTSCRS